jgi:hypothetical protein
MFNELETTITIRRTIDLAGVIGRTANQQLSQMTPGFDLSSSMIIIGQLDKMPLFRWLLCKRKGGLTLEKQETRGKQMIMI